MSRQIRISLCVILAFLVLHVTGVISYLLRDGRLSMVPIYDDVVYLIDALRRLSVLDKQGLAGVLFDLYRQPPHAPLVAITGMFGLMLSAGAPWGPYVLSAGWLVFILALGWFGLRRAPPGTRAGILVAVLATPIFGFVLSEFRPDAVWGLLVGFSVLVSSSSRVIWMQPRKLFALGLLFGATIVFKPTASPGSVAVLVVAWCVQLVALMWAERDWAIGRATKASSLVLLGALFLVVPYLVANGAGILAYMREVMAGNSMWGTPGSTWVHMTYYLNRSLGTTALGWIWYAALPLLVLCGAFIVGRRDRHALPAFAALTSTTVAAYAIVTVTTMKTLMIGSLLYGAIVAGAVWSMSYLLMLIPLRAGPVLVLGALLFALQWVPRVGQVHKQDPSMLAADVANRAILPALGEVLKARPTASVLVTVPGPTYAGTLDFMVREQGIVRPFQAGYTAESWERVQQLVGAAEVIVLSEVGMVGQSLGWTFPSLQFQTRLLDQLRAGSEFTGRRTFTDAQGRSVWLFVRNR